MNPILRRLLGRLLAILLPIACEGTAFAQLYEFTTLAGRSSIGSSDGLGNNARFSGPEGVAVDSTGDLLVADTKNHTIRRITPGGVVTTVAGVATLKGSADGAGSEARFNFPTGIVVDLDGNIFVADRGNHTIRKITRSGIVTTVAGVAAASGSADGAASAACLNSPSGVALDSGRNLIVADTGNHTIRKITPSGVVSTLAGAAGSSGSIDGIGSAARFGAPYGVFVDAGGSVLVTDTESSGSSRFPMSVYTVRRITPDGVVATVAKVTSFNLVSSAFEAPRGVVADRAGNIVFADAGFHLIWKIAPDGVRSIVAGGIEGLPDGGSADGAGTAVRFSYPAGLAVDVSGNIFIADSHNNTIRRLALDGLVSTIAGSAAGSGLADGAGAAARFSQPSAIAASALGDVFVADTQTNVIRKISPSGLVSTVAGVAGHAGAADGLAAAATFSSPRGIAVDPSGNIYVADTGNATIRKIGLDGMVTTFAGTAGRKGTSDGVRAAASFATPWGIAVDRGGVVWVVDNDNGRLRSITPDGVASTIIGSDIRPLTFQNPRGVAVDRSENILIVDNDASLKKVVLSDGILGRVTELTTYVPGQYTDGAGGVTVDNEGNAFVTGRFYHTVRRVTPDGVVTAVAGNFLGTVSEYGSSDGPGFAAQFFNPAGIAVDAVGNLFVADTGNNVIRRGTPSTDPARLVNCSVLASLAGADDALTLGAITGGAGTSGAKPLLLRAAGPSLAVFGITNPLPDPRLEFFTGTTKLAENDNWAGAPELSATFQAVRAFPFESPESKDAALALSAVSAGGATVRVMENGAEPGIVLAELYDATPASAYRATMPRLTNVSVLRYFDSDLTTGFIVGGVGTKTLVIRAVGPSLGSFGLSDCLDDPKLEVFDGRSHRIAANDNWSEGGQASALSLNATFPQVGAFRLLGASLDAALVVTLTPGNYTVKVGRGGVGRPTGFVLVEVYEVP